MEKPEFKVPHRFKVAFVWLSIAAMGILVSYQVNKRTSYWYRHVSNVMQPVNVEKKPETNLNLLSLFDEPQTESPEDPAALPVIYHFWATWCAPCRAEIPTLNELQKRFKSQLKVVTIAVDENKDDITRFFGNATPHFQVLWDQSQTVAEKWGIQKYPETFLVMPGGNRLLKFSGPRDWNSPEAVDFITRALSQPS